MTDATLWALFLAIVQLESGGDLKAKNGKAVGPAQIQPGVVLDCIKWGHAVEMRDRETLEGSFRLFRLYLKYLEETGIRSFISLRQAVVERRRIILSCINTMAQPLR